MFGFLISQDKALVLTALTVIDVMSVYGNKKWREKVLMVQELARQQIGQFSLVPVLTRLLGVADEELQLKCLYLLRNMSYYGNVTGITVYKK